jgi:hypothetical protein
VDDSKFRAELALLQTFEFVKFLQIFRYRLSTACAGRRFLLQTVHPDHSLLPNDPTH